MAENEKIERWSPLQVWLYSLFSRDTKRRGMVVDALGLQRGDSLLDLGCGLGQVLEMAAERGATVSGVDPSPSMVRRARQRVPGARIELGSAEDIPFPDHSFTHVLGLATFHHWMDRELGLSEAVRVLGPGGRLMIVEKWLASGTGHGLSTTDAESLAAKLEEMGLIDTVVGYLASGRHRMVTVTGRRPS
ncbi:MAG TPA: class I SAM-dependent methyltransferase [Acidimicrobiia bacterium]